jgi:hypothetical protein
MLAALIGSLGLALMAAALFRETPLGRLLHRQLVETPLRLAHQMERKHIFIVLILLFCGQSLLVLGSMELAVIVAWDMSLYLDAVLAAWTLAAMGRIKAARERSGAGVSRAATRCIAPFRRAGRGRRSRRITGGRTAANDEEGPPAFAFALAA